MQYSLHLKKILSPVLRACNSKETLAKHLKATCGKVLTRFPPEPNGYLHVGHAKAMFVDFGLTKERGGGCYLRILRMSMMKIQAMVTRMENCDYICMLILY